MTNSKSTKRSLLMSAMSMLLCVSMLLGTTFAWFTDTVTSANNIIKSGNLDIELDYWDGANWKTVQGASDILTNELWEPGVTEVAYLRLSNEGSLALKYQLGVNIVSEKTGTNVAGKTFKLSDYIYFDVIEGVNGQMNPYNRETVKNVTTQNTKISAGYTKEAEIKANDPEHYLALVVHMPTTVTNEANHNGKDIPEIALGINVFATQLANESDTFGPEYDEDAVYYDTLVTTADELYAAVGNAGESTVIAIDGNIKLTKALSKAGLKDIKFVAFSDDAVIDQATYNMHFSGAKVTFEGLTLTHGEKTYGNGGQTSTAFAVWDASEVNYIDCTFNRSVGTIHAKLHNFIRCTFNGVENPGNTKSEYPLYICDGQDYNVIDCVFNCTNRGAILFYNDGGNGTDTLNISNTQFLGDIIADKTAVEIHNNSASQVYNVNIDNVVVGSGIINGLYRIKPANVGEVNVKVDNVASAATNSAELKNAIKDNTTVYLQAGDYTLPSLANNTGVTIEGAEGAVIGGDNATTGFSSNFGKDTTIKNITFSGKSNGVRWSYAKGGTTTFEDCTFAGDSVYGFHIDSSNGATFIFNNCTFKGFNAFAGDLKKVVFNNCTFLSNGNYGHTNIWSVGEFNNCTWGDKTSVSPGSGGGDLYFNGVKESYHHEFIGSAESLFDFAKSVNEGKDSWKGQKVILVDDIDLNNAVWAPIGQTGATEFKGIFDGQNHTIKNLNIDSSAQTGEHYSSGLFGWAESGVTIQNVIVNGAKVVGNHNVAVIVGYTYSSKIINCHVTNADIVCNHANDDACGDKCGIIGGYAGDESRFTNCSATDCTVKAGRDAGQIIGCGYNKSIKDCSATNVTVTATGECTGANINENLIGRVMA